MLLVLGVGFCLVEIGCVPFPRYAMFKLQMMQDDERGDALLAALAHENSNLA